MNGRSMNPTIERETRRILAETARRDKEIPPERYAIWQPSEQWFIYERRATALAMLKRCGALPGRHTKALEIGFGYGGWLPDLISWGVKEANLHGIEISERCVRNASEWLPSANLRLGNGAMLPWEERTFDLVITSTLCTSILDETVRRQVADEIVRVLIPGGVLLWYDFRFNNPRNPNVRGIGRSELRALFPSLRGEVRSISLLPPLCRAVAPVSIFLTALLSAVPFLCTHLLAVLKKPPDESSAPAS